MQSAMFVLHAGGRGPAITSTRTPHNARNLPPLVRLRLPRRHQDQTHWWRAYSAEGYSPIDAPDRFSALPGPEGTLLNNQWHIIIPEIRQHGGSGLDGSELELGYAGSMAIPNHDKAERLRSSNEEHRANSRNE